jgi:hypothetical protein
MPNEPHERLMRWTRNVEKCWRNEVVNAVKARRRDGRKRYELEQLLLNITAGSLRTGFDRIYKYTFVIPYQPTPAGSDISSVLQCTRASDFIVHLLALRIYLKGARRHKASRCYYESRRS